MSWVLISNRKTTSFQLSRKFVEFSLNLTPQNVRKPRESHVIVLFMYWNHVIFRFFARSLVLRCKIGQRNGAILLDKQATFEPF